MGCLVRLIFGHGSKVIQWERQTDFVRKHLINQVELIAEGEGWKEERTGLHENEFIETRRHWFTGMVSHHTGGGANVLNVIEGDELLVESETDALFLLLRIMRKPLSFPPA